MARAIVGAEHPMSCVARPDDWTEACSVAPGVFGNRSRVHPGWMVLVGKRLIGFIKVHTAASAVVEASLLTLRARTDAGRLAGFPSQVETDSERNQGCGDENYHHESLGSRAHRARRRWGVATG